MELRLTPSPVISLSATLALGFKFYWIQKPSRAVFYQIFDIFFSAIPSKIIKTIVGRIAVVVAGVVLWTWPVSYKCFQNKDMNPFMGDSPDIVKRYQKISAGSLTRLHQLALEFMQTS